MIELAYCARIIFNANYIWCSRYVRWRTFTEIKCTRSSLARERKTRQFLSSHLFLRPKHTLFGTMLMPCTRRVQIHFRIFHSTSGVDHKIHLFVTGMHVSRCKQLSRVVFAGARIRKLLPEQTKRCASHFCNVFAYSVVHMVRCTSWKVGGRIMAHRHTNTPEMQSTMQYVHRWNTRGDYPLLCSSNVLAHILKLYVSMELA